ncbi:trans-aconitate 2-methyltransferase [Streptomyces sp. KL116D]|uniref:class I SAM-dependent methyltransferase n=1 Tax=Streptomyces sp. KL116D TaxID=3045152 RepID=UPI003557F4EF
MVDHAFTDARLARLYDALNPWAACDDFYLDLVRGAGSVLDVGCGTGALLARAREEGHGGRLVGLDPAAGMLAVARERGDVEWVRGTLRSARVAGGFDLVVMTGHAFQVWVDDDEIRASLAAVRDVLGAGGRFAFETRNPLARAWERWGSARVGDVRVTHDVVGGFDGRTVTFTTTYDVVGWGGAEVSRSTLRFLSEGELDGFLTEAGFTVTARYGDWTGSPFAPDSPEIITVCEALPR